MKNYCLIPFKLATGALLVLVAAHSDSLAQQSCQQCQSPSLSQRFCAGYDANVRWPAIYIPPARRSVCATYSAMINNGWRRQNLLGDYHFDKESNELTSAGKLKVNWIFSQAPVQRRNVFVQRGNQEVQTAARVAAVHEYAGNMSPGVGQISVSDTHIVAEGHAASAVDSVFVGYQANRLPPVLPASTAASSE